MKKFREWFYATTMNNRDLFPHIYFGACLAILVASLIYFGVDG